MSTTGDNTNPMNPEANKQGGAQNAGQSGNPNAQNQNQAGNPNQGNQNQNDPNRTENSTQHIKQGGPGNQSEYNSDEEQRGGQNQGTNQWGNQGQNQNQNKPNQDQPGAQNQNNPQSSNQGSQNQNTPGHEQQVGQHSNPSNPNLNKEGDMKKTAPFTIKMDNWKQQSEQLKENYNQLTDADLKFEPGKENDLLERVGSKLNKNRDEVIDIFNRYQA